MADLYSILGVERGADAAHIKRAYRKLAKELHPDQNKDNPRAAERFKAVTAAYDILSDKEKRARYDRGEIDDQGNPRGFGGGGSPFGTGGGAGPFGAGGGFRSSRPGGGASGSGRGGFRDSPPDFDIAGDPSDLFAELFGRAGRSGGMGGGFRPPPARGADIAYRLAISFADAALAARQRLTLASGKTIDLSIPRGVEDGQQLRLAGQGEQGPAGAGDAIVTIMIQSDPRFTRDGADIRADIAVPLEVAVLGGEQRVPTPEGDVNLKIAPGTSSGRTMRLKGKGWTKKDGSRGDLLARVLVELPTDDAGLAAFLRSRAAATAG